MQDIGEEIKDENKYESDLKVEYKEIKGLERMFTIKNDHLLLIDDPTEETKAITYENAIKKIYSDIMKTISLTTSVEKTDDMDYVFVVHKVFKDIMKLIVSSKKEENEEYKDGIKKIYLETLEMIAKEYHNKQGFDNLKTSYQNAINKIYEDLRQTINNNIPRYSLPSYLEENYLKGIPYNLENRTINPTVLDIDSRYSSYSTYLSNMNNTPHELRVSNSTKQDYRFIIKVSESDVGKTFYLNARLTCLHNIGGYTAGVYLTFLSDYDINNNNHRTQAYGIGSISTYNYSVQYIFNGWYRLEKIKNRHGNTVPKLLKL